MSNKQEATWHDGIECPGTPHRGHTRTAEGEQGMLVHQGEGSVCDGQQPTRMAVTDLKHDDKTLEKVRAALHYILGGNIADQRLTDCIGEMQNRGILFRERDNG